MLQLSRSFEPRTTYLRSISSMCAYFGLGLSFDRTDRYRIGFTFITDAIYIYLYVTVLSFLTCRKGKRDTDIVATMDHSCVENVPAESRLYR